MLLLPIEASILDGVKDRLPGKQDAFLLFTTCVFPIHVWAILIFLNDAPAYIRRMPFGDIAGIFAYTQVIALIESLIFWGFLLFVCISMPRKYFKDWFISQGTLLVLGFFILVIPMHYQMDIIEGLQWNLELYDIMFVVWLLLWLAGLIIMSTLIRRNLIFEKKLVNLVDRIMLLSLLYVLIDVVSFAFVIFRNIR